MKDIKDRRPNQNTIKHLENLLERAKSGELRTIVAVAGWNDDTWTSGWSIDGRNSRRRLIGEVTLMQHDIVTNQLLDDGDTILASCFDGE